ncbi:hypothetical protein PMAYCL1PPCAC_32489 [Pristionchus mayeri]|uniref:C6 domain-containing protein n=1 Tax=Pristionchus mayeri TaxID=1317129 RepID=A0AAN5IF15_9BILA|nr:hypothetical protein PMAYCL1PPCAC_32489 [Pristionchus mayeri]
MSSLLPSLLLVLSFAVAAAADACVGCKCCSSDLITITTSGSGAHPFDSDVIDQTGECAVRTLTCRGELANIEVNGDGGIVFGEPDAVMEVTCNAEGTFWDFQGVPITQAECASKTIE